MAPLQDSLTNYQAITHKAISTVNQHTFSAIGCGDLLIHIPNGCTNFKILLRDILHTPNIVQTLISIRLISNAGYSITFKDGTCTICDSNGTVMGKIPKQEGLYRVNKGGVQIIFTYVQESHEKTREDWSISSPMVVSSCVMVFITLGAMCLSHW